MACLDMYNSERKGIGSGGAPMSPRISFSNDFADSHSQGNIVKQERGSREAPVSTDFEFSVTNYSMMSADQLFFKGRLLPLKDACSNNQMQRTTTTLREELLVDDGEDVDRSGFSLKPPKGSSTRWKGLLGLRKSHIGSKKPEKNDGFSTMERAAESKRTAFSIEAPNASKSPPEMMADEGSSTDMEMKFIREMEGVQINRQGC
ncbi:hypothetical protein Nepgr_016617 [Nepenthes gracilis]|uniref:Uncharacterized protein n=1 Tax=Nepenthes gracilis TaxID=150966 RepID=A0AAD3XSI2_NEPGR|nr:hypothetical protein Nepgr_016617 [Nepenthes gracilis]